MKKLILILCLLIVLITGVVYFLIPPSLSISYQKTVGTTENGIMRILLNKEKLLLWFPAKRRTDALYVYQNCTYKIDKMIVSGIVATVFSDSDSSKGMLGIIGAGNHSTQIQWTSNFIFSTNPIKKLVQYANFKNIKNNIQSFISDIKYFDNEENIYGIKVEKHKVTDASLISVKQSFNHYPTTQEIYSMINSLKEYIEQKNGEENNYPMLNVHREDSIIYEAMAAIPTKQDMPSEGKFRLKKMVLGNILMAEVKGGVYTVMKGEEELKNYVTDYKKISPAIPFQSLVTNRLLEPDTTKWITRLYYPIFN